MRQQARVPVAAVSPDPTAVQQLKYALAASPEWGIDLVYGTCDPETMLLNVHLHSPVCFILDLDLGKELTLVLVGALQRAGYRHFIFIGPAWPNHSLPGEVIAHGAPIYSIVSAVYRLSAGPLGDAPRSVPAGQKRRNPVLITVHSPKGGSGKTMLACSLAVQYAAKGLPTILVDLSMYGGVAPSLGLPRREKGLAKVLELVEQDPAVLEMPTMPRILEANLWQFPVGDRRLDILPAAPPLKMAKLSVEQAESLLRWIRSEPYDVVIIDTSMEVSERTAVAMKLSNFTVLVMTPELSAAWAVLSMQDLLKSLDVTGKLQVVLNRSTKGVNVKELEMALGYPIAAQIPETDHPWENAVGKNLVRDYSALGLALKRLAQRFYAVYSAGEIPAMKGRADRTWTSSNG